MKFKTAFAAAAALTLATTAHAQVGPEVGATIYTSEGEEVATIESLENGIAVVNTGTHTGSIPAQALGEGPDGPVISVTKAQLDQLFEQQEAQTMAARDKALVADAAVTTPNAVAVGTVESVEGDNVVLAMPEGSVALMRENFSADANGGLVVLFTQAQLVSALEGGVAPEASEMAEGGEMAGADAE
ncbi:hypothetical protein [Alteriqipengyuania sp. 357]